MKTLREELSNRLKFSLCNTESLVNEIISLIEERDKECVVITDVRSAKADGNAEENFDYGYDIRTNEIREKLQSSLG